MIQHLSDYKYEEGKNEIINTKIINYLLKKQQISAQGQPMKQTDYDFELKRIQHPQNYADLKQILLDPVWKKAVFYREPLSRFLSAYLFSCRGDAKWRWMCKDIFGSYDASLSTAVAFLRSFRVAVGSDGNYQYDYSMIDEHFRPQSEFCGGNLNETIQFYGIVKELDPSTSRKNVEEIFSDYLFENDVLTSKFEMLFPLNGKILGSKHDTNAHDQVYDFYSRQDPELIGDIVDFYYPDYVIFNISLPSFALESLRNLNKLRKFSDTKLAQLEMIRSLIYTEKGSYHDCSNNYVIFFGTTVVFVVAYWWYGKISKKHLKHE
eukprot:CAMPEP_0113299348 /NCGR_PEP_ID=MMETSP0010_2-20120614/1423_1 /TAXON_ID=216773 ORGANISM="Corethron hystrix, Strain 308" /NCGR_SAMPLE_ID=MMETSP0010_2 /ASSEMBLY_ACC=CAM_ASM_000155 /LENGTH=320 /DNA_ID=CAMNT_0000152573 /DNA_START=222 /DNA_END=1184 /DNA_ORIENTATION=+ /assembly_acc=CAM_ASM_000155